MTRKRDTRTPEQREADMMREHEERQEARLNETLTRREVIEAIESVANDYAQRRDHESDVICNAFQSLADALA